MDFQFPDKVKMIVLNIFDSDEIISESNRAEWFNQAVEKVKHIAYRFKEDIEFINDLVIHEQPRPKNNIKLAIYDVSGDGNVKAFIYN